MRAITATLLALTCGFAFGTMMNECPARAASVQPIATEAPTGERASPQVPAEPKTVAQCLEAAERHAAVRAKELRAAGQPVDRAKLTQEAADLAKQCAARFSIGTVAVGDLTLLAQLYAAAQQPLLARQAIAKRLGTPGITDGERADTLVAGVDISMGRSATDEGAKAAEAYVSQLDAIRNAGRQQIKAHSQLGGYYRAPVTERAALASMLAAAYTNVAEVYGGREQADKAVEVLEQGLADFGSAPAAKLQIEPTLARYRLVGTGAAPIEAPHWLNAPAGTSKAEIKGTVTLIEFTAHWCTWCRRTYPSIVRLHDRWAPKGLQVIFATELYGFFGQPRALPAEQELEADRRYFVEEHRLPFKIAIESQRQPVPGQSAAPNLNEDRYKVGGIPQIVVIDKAGTIRLIIIGSDPSSEARLDDVVQRLLREPTAEQ